MSSSEKIVAFEELVRLVEQLRRQSKRIVHCHGVFDLLHIGHIRYLQAARNQGDALVVTLTPDRFVNKGPHRPIFDEKLRCQAVAALSCVDHVAVNCWPTAMETLRRLRPDVFAKGAEFRDRKTPELAQEEATAAALGIPVEFIDEITSSSSALINQRLSPFSEEVDHYLLQFRQRQTAEALLGRLEQSKQLRVLVVGEAIVDEYVTCAALGQSTKSPAVVARFQGLDRFAGGALAVANHVAPFCREVQLLAMLGAAEPDIRDQPAGGNSTPASARCGSTDLVAARPLGEDWIRGQLRARVQPTFFYRSHAPTIVKRQYREVYYAVPLFEIDNLNDAALTTEETARLEELLQPLLPDADVVLVADYGHGMLSEAAVRRLSAGARFLAVNTPANAANLGYHTLSKYRRADYLSMAEQELRLECRSRTEALPELLEQVARRVGAAAATVTVGNRGCLCYGPQQGHVQAPALASRVVDRFGAGEAFFAMSALCAGLHLPLEQLAFLGNVAAAEAVAVLGNSRFLEEVPFRRHIESLLK
jgi:rfaE bifunctional protein nucleotidyltransferase chain/domain